MYSPMLCSIYLSLRFTVVQRLPNLVSFNLYLRLTWKTLWGVWRSTSTHPFRFRNPAAKKMPTIGALSSKFHGPPNFDCEAHCEKLSKSCIIL